MDLGPVERITVGTIGEPGARTFYLQARSGDRLVSIVVEKQQVQLLSASILELLADLQLETSVGRDEAMDLEEPVDPIWRAGKLSIGYDHDAQRFMLEIEEFVPDPETDLDTDLEPGDPRIALAAPDPDVVRIGATSEQMLALSRHGAVVVDAGRPTCQFCGNPMDAEGHACPAMNGHSSSR
jgi:uncharacterized repeat protein (TIGR03847 family)